MGRIGVPDPCTGTRSPTHPTPLCGSRGSTSSTPHEELELSHFFEELPHPSIKIFLFDCVPYFDPNNIKSRISPGRISGAPGVVGLTHGEDAAAEFNGVNATADERKKGEYNRHHIHTHIFPE